MIEAMLALAALFGLATEGQAAPAPAPVAPYAEGQVWEYRTRPGEEGSLLRIQRIEPWPAAGSDGLVFHISVIGLRLGEARDIGEMQHLPVARRTLDLSVTRLSTSTAAFPSADPGIAIWREDRGGIFDIALAEALEVADQAIRQQQRPPGTTA